MRILVVHNYYRQRGGEDSIVDGLVQLLRDHGHSVRFLSADSGQIAGFSRGRRMGLPVEAVYSRRTAAQLSQVVADFRPDVAHVQNVFPVLSPSVYWALHDRVPIVHSIQNFRFVCPNGLAFTRGSICLRCRRGNTVAAVALRCLHGDLAQSALYALVIGLHRQLRTFPARTGRLLPVNSMLAQILTEEFPDASVAVLPNFIECRRFTPRSEPGNSFVFLGRLSEEKGIRVLIEALPLTRGFMLDVVGDGPLRADLEGRANAQGEGRTTFHGFVGGEARFELLKRARALVMPSLSHDACPVAVLEAMALGVPVVAARRGGLPDLVEDGETGLLFESGRVDELAGALQRLHDSPSLADGMGRRARMKAEAEFDAEVFHGRLVKEYESAIEDRRR